MWELDYKKSSVLKNWCFWTVVLEETLESPLDCKEIQPVLSVHWKDWCWSWNSNTLVTWCEELLNCAVREDSWESLGLQEDPTSLECSLEGLMLKLKLQYFGHLMRRADSFEKTLMLAKIEGGRRRGRQRIRWLDGITDSMGMSLGKLRDWWWLGRPGVLQSLGSQRVGHDWATELNWTNWWAAVCQTVFLMMYLDCC